MARASAAWSILGHLTMNYPDLPDEVFEKRFELIEREIHTSKNRLRQR